MMQLLPTRSARLVSGIHPPRGATLAECLALWRALAPAERFASYLVVDGDADGTRVTLNAARIAALAASAGEA